MKVSQRASELEWNFIVRLTLPITVIAMGEAVSAK